MQDDSTIGLFKPKSERAPPPSRGTRSGDPSRISGHEMYARMDPLELQQQQHQACPKT
jgi:hypothetical protein